MIDLEKWIDRVHADALMAFGVQDEFLASIAAALMSRGVLSAEEVAAALEAQQRFIEHRLAQGDDVRILGGSLELFAERLREHALRAGLELPRLRPWRGRPDEAWPGFED